MCINRCLKIVNLIHSGVHLSSFRLLLPLVKEFVLPSRNLFHLKVVGDMPVLYQNVSFAAERIQLVSQYSKTFACIFSFLFAS